MRSRLAILKEQAAGRPVIVITTRDADAARMTRDLAVDEVLWLSEIEPRLAEVVFEALARGFASRVVAAADSAEHLPRSVKRAIRLVMQDAGALPSIQQLAKVLHISRSQLWKEWRRALPQGPTLERFLDWVLLLRAVSRRTSDVSWMRIAEDFGVHQHTLSGIAERVANKRLATSDDSSYHELVILFRHEMLRPLRLQLDVDEK